MWVWLLEGNTSKTSPAAPALMVRAAAGGNLYVSDISFWEVAQKAAKGKLVLSLPVSIWLARAERAPGISYISLDRTILIQSALPSPLRGDPADRLLVATAQLRSTPLMTVDAEIIRYAESQPGVPVCDARR